MSEDTAGTLHFDRIAYSLSNSQLVIGLQSPPGHGNATLNGQTLTYTPAANYYGSDQLGYIVTDDQGQQAQGTIAITVAPVNDAPQVSLTADPLSGATPLDVALTAVASDIEGDPLSYAWAFGDGQAAPAGANAQIAHRYERLGSFVARVTVSDGAATNTASQVVAVDTLPIPAPPIDQTVASTLIDTSAFLYSEPNPIQTGVAPGTFAAQRVAVLRGRTLDRDGQPLPDVRITVPQHPEFGQTLTRADGRFDLVVNGGQPLTLAYVRDGYLPVQRQLPVPWQDYVVFDDVVLTPFDQASTRIDLGAADPFQVARGSVISDTSGTRQSTLLIPQGTQAELVLADGTTRPASTLTMRATEYTVGERGPAAMPGDLPPQSGYTYAIELSVDEALAAGAVDVRFSQPLYHYTENFLGFPAGTPVPAGYYDRARAAWVPAESGVVVTIVSISDGLANLDTDGDGAADNSAALGITAAERQRLAELYRAGQSLWRVPIRHFTPWDFNWPFGPPGDAIAPFFEWLAGIFQPTDNACTAPGSVIECENQVLGEVVGVTGTPFTLHYQSDRAPGYKPYLDIPLSGASLPASLDRIELEITVAGRRFARSFPATPDQQYRFIWDGRDAYGRTLQGRQPVTIRLGYTYPGSYQRTDRFGYNGNGIPISGDRARQEVTLWQEWRATIGTISANGYMPGGWTLSAHHFYDPIGQVLYQGTGERRSVQGFESTLTTTLALSTGDYVGVAFGPDGSLYIAEDLAHRVRRVAPDGAVTLVAGTGRAGATGDGGPATQAQLNRPQALAFGPDGSLYIADVNNHKIRRVAPDGRISTYAGTGAAGFSGDNGPATQARLNTPNGVAVAPDGTLYIADHANHRVRRVGPDGVITTIAGTGAAGFGGDDGPATQARLNRPWGLALGPDGSLYVADNANHRVRRIDPRGSITTVAGTGVAGFGDDGLPATSAALNEPSAIAVALDGGLYIADRSNYRIRSVSPSGYIRTLVGTGTSGFNGDSLAAGQARIGLVHGLALDPAGNLTIADAGNRRIRRMAPVLPTFDGSALAIVSSDGGELYEFSAAGRHLRTRNTWTGAVRYSFGYDGSGRLAQISDGDGNLTRIERDAAGALTAIVGPYGQRTTFSTDVSGYLAAITNPAGETTHFSYSGDGLLTSLTDARGGIATYSYDGQGRLSAARNRAGSTTTLTRADTLTATRATLAWRRSLVWTGAQEGPRDSAGHSWFAADFDDSAWGPITLPEHVSDSQRNDRYYRAHFVWDGVSPVTLRFAADDGLAIYINGTPLGSWGNGWRNVGCVNPPYGCSSTVTIPPQPVSPALLRQGENVIAVDVWNGAATQVYFDASLTLGGVGYRITKTNGLGDQTHYFVATTPAGVQYRATVAPNGATVTQLQNPNGTTVTTDARGVITEMTVAADPRWGMQAPYISAMTSRTADGRLFASMGMQRQIDPPTPADPLALRSQTDILTTHTHTSQQRVTRSVYDTLTSTRTTTDPVGLRTTAVIDAQGRVVREEATDHAPVVSSYDQRGRLIQVAEGEGGATRITTLAYDDQGNLASQTDALGNVTAYSYDAAGRPLSTTLPTGQVLRMAYDANGNLVSSTDAQGVETTYVYDALDRLIAQTLDPLGRAVRTVYTYDAVGNLRTVVADAGDGRLNLTTGYTYVPIDADGGYAVSQATDPLGNTTSYAYTPFGAVRSVTEPLGHTTVMSYTAQGWPSETRTPGGLVARAQYNDDGLPTRATDPRGGTTDYQYDAVGRLAQVRVGTTGLPGAPALNLTTSFSYDLNRRVVGVNDPRGGVSTRIYDLFGRLVSERDPAGGTVTSTYDALDRLVRQVVGGDVTGEALTVAYSYDAAGRRTSEIIDPDGLHLTTSYRYTLPGSSDTWNLQEQIDPRGSATTFSYNTLGLLASTTDAGGATWQFGYDNLGRLTSQTDARGNRTVMVPDALGRTLSLTSDGRTERWAYNGDGTQASYTSFAGQVTAYGYDTDRRLTAIDYPAGTADVAYSYDAAGNVTLMSDGLGATSYRYDVMNRLIERTRGGRTVGYTYNSTGQTTQISYWGTGSVQYGYDQAGRVTSLAPWGAAATTYQYRSTGLLRSQQRPNGVATSYSYDSASRLTAIDHRLGQTSLSAFAYSLDATGNRLSETNGSGTAAYSYDSLSRLTTASYPAIPGGPAASSVDYTLDAVGNRLSDGLTSYSYDASDRITSPAGYSYDANGNLLSDGATSYTYDAANRLTGTTRGGVTTAYGYDGWGNLIQETVNGVTTEFVLDEARDLPVVLGEVRSDGGVIRYAYGPDGVAAQQNSGSLTQGLYYPLLDALGSVRHLADTSAALALSRSYDAFGGVRFQTGGALTTLGFAGERTSAADGTIYLRARHYQPALGRFLQRDTFAGVAGQPQSLNRYAYAENNPATWTDPSGRCIGWIWGSADCQFVGLNPANWNWGELARPGDTIRELLSPCGLDSLQTGLDVIGLIPGLGEPADALNGLISLARGDTLGAALSFAAVIPFAGWAATGAKFGRRGLSHLDEVAGLLRYQDEMAAVARRGDNLADSASATRRIDGLCPVRLNSFDADTLVLTPDGEKPISEVKEGDAVLAYNETTRTTGSYTVTAAFSHLDPVVVELTIGGETLETTPEHPFYVLLRGWVEAGDLRPGLSARRVDGTYGVVEQVELVQRSQRMYNLTVADAHTFFVGDEAWLVHNACHDQFDIVRYGTNIVKVNKDRMLNGLERLEKHHGVMNEWAAVHFNALGYTKRGAPSLLLTESQHEATKKVYRDWLREHYGQPVGVSPDWLTMSPRTAHLLTVRMFDAAHIPDNVQRAYFSAWNKYMYGMR